MKIKGATLLSEPVYMLHVTDIGLATVKDVEECYELIPCTLGSWWICNENRSAMVANWVVGGYETDIVTPDDFTHGIENKFIGIRPKLTLLKEDGENFEIGEEVDFLGKRWTFIRENEIICNEIIAYGPWDNPNPYHLIEEHRSRADSAYDASTLKTFLEEWLKNR